MQPTLSANNTSESVFVRFAVSPHERGNPWDGYWLWKGKVRSMAFAFIPYVLSPHRCYQWHSLECAARAIHSTWRLNRNAWQQQAEMESSNASENDANAFTLLTGRCVRIPAREATDEELTTVHSPRHVTLMRAISSGDISDEERLALSHTFNSIFFNRGSTSSALLSAGSVVELALRLCSPSPSASPSSPSLFPASSGPPPRLSAGAAVVRPPGHHAESHCPMGFCLYNNVAVAARVLLDRKVRGEPTQGQEGERGADTRTGRGEGSLGAA